jgi:hypothetical protein
LTLLSRPRFTFLMGTGAPQCPAASIRPAHPPFHPATMTQEGLSEQGTPFPAGTAAPHPAVVAAWPGEALETGALSPGAGHRRTLTWIRGLVSTGGGVLHGGMVLDGKRAVGVPHLRLQRLRLEVGHPVSAAELSEPRSEGDAEAPQAPRPGTPPEAGAALATARAILATRIEALGRALGQEGLGFLELRPVLLVVHPAGNNLKGEGGEGADVGPLTPSHRVEVVPLRASSFGSRAPDHPRDPEGPLSP